MPKSVLVADDSVTMRKVIGLIFAHEDFTLTVVDNGLDAIHRARELRPDVVLADCMMPGKSGYEVCEAIKNDPSTQHIPVMLLAGTFEPFDENRARAARADAHVVKPFESQAFLDKVKGMVGMPAGVPVMTGYQTVSTASLVNPPKAAAAPAPPPGNNPRPMPGPAGMPGPTGMPMARPPGQPLPPGTVPGLRNPMGGIPPAPQGMPMGRPPPPAGQPGMPMGRPPGQMMGTSPGAPNPMMQGRPGGPMMGAPGMPPQGMPMGARPPGPGMGQPPPQQGFPRPPGGAPMPGAVPPRRDPFGLGGAPGMPPQQPAQPQYRQPPPPGGPQYRPPPPQQPQHHAPQHHAPQHNPLSLEGDGGEAALRNALSQASREVIEKIAWEVVPQLAEAIIRQELDRLIKDREAKN